MVEIIVLCMNVCHSLPQPVCDLIMVLRDGSGHGVGFRSAYEGVSVGDHHLLGSNICSAENYSFLLSIPSPLLRSDERDGETRFAGQRVGGAQVALIAVDIRI
jgi:hypothetical protein